MTQKNALILLVEDSPSLATVYQQYLNKMPYRVKYVNTGMDACQFLAEQLPDVVLLDLKLPDMSGMDILQQIHEQQLPTEAIIITAHGTIDSAVDAMRFGAFDYLEKPFDAKRLQVTLENALEHQHLTHLVETYRESERMQYQGFIGASLQMQSVYRIIDSAAPSKATVFISGESGTGKEVCAQAIHDLSPRADKPFIALNCAAIPKDLMESEIFGHIKGAFTGAAAERKGAASMANGGTLFLDEICEMDMELQSKLLRFLQTSSFQKVGSGHLETVDVRIVCATNRDPLDEVRQGRFREDLYYRLHVIPIQLPALRERENDVLLLAEHLLVEFAGEENKPPMALTPETKALLLDYSWPGNVRELQNIMRNVVVLNHDKPQLTPELLPPPLDQLSSPTPLAAHVNNPTVNTTNHQIAAAPVNHVETHIPTAIRPLWLVEKDTIEHAIALADGNIPKAAALLEISPSTIYRKRQTWEDAQRL